MSPKSRPFTYGCVSDPLSVPGYAMSWLTHPYKKVTAFNIHRKSWNKTDLQTKHTGKKGHDNSSNGWINKNDHRGWGATKPELNISKNIQYTQALVQKKKGNKDLRGCIILYSGASLAKHVVGWLLYADRRDGNKN